MTDTESSFNENLDSLDSSAPAAGEAPAESVPFHHPDAAAEVSDHLPPAGLPHERLLQDLFRQRSNFFDITKKDFPTEYHREDFLRELRFENERNAIENRVIAAVVAGNAAQAKRELRKSREHLDGASSTLTIEQMDPLRQFKDSVISMNAIQRKAIEAAHVPNIYISHYATHFTWLIEQAETFEAVSAVVDQMIDTYCWLAAHYSLAAYSPAVRNVILFLDEHIVENISVQTLAEQQNLTPNYLSALFKKEVGVPIMEYVCRRRIREACHLLRDSSLSIRDIAIETGFGDPNYFTRRFKAQTGTTPLQYRKQNTESNRESNMDGSLC